MRKQRWKFAFSGGPFYYFLRVDPEGRPITETYLDVVCFPVADFWKVRA